jgi:hypothetical protein
MDLRTPFVEGWAELPDRGLLSAAMGEIDETVKLSSERDQFVHDIEPLTRGQRAIFATYWCVSEVLNGGLYQFFYNHTGVLTPEAGEGFSLLNARTCASLLEQAANLFPDNAVPESWGDRQDALASLGVEPFRQLSRSFVAATDGEEDIEKLAARYIRAHPEEFFR